MRGSGKVAATLSWQGELLAAELERRFHRPRRELDTCLGVPFEARARGNEAELQLFGGPRLGLHVRRQLDAVAHELAARVADQRFDQAAAMHGQLDREVAPRWLRCRQCAAPPALPSHPRARRCPQLRRCRQPRRYRRRRLWLCPPSRKLLQEPASNNNGTRNKTHRESVLGNGF